MGADIYLKSVYDVAYAKAKPAFEAAVAARDAYLNEHGRAVRSTPQYRQLQAEVEKTYDAMYPEDGYYRDSYNTTSLFSMLGLSWWQVSGDDGEGDPRLGKLIKNGEMYIPSMEKLLGFLKEVDLDARFDKWVGDLGDKKDPEFDPEEWRGYFHRKRNRLMRLLEKAIELKEPLRCSV